MDGQGEKLIVGVAPKSRVHIVETELLHVYRAAICRVLFYLAERGVEPFYVEDKDLGQLNEQVSHLGLCLFMTFLACVVVIECAFIIVFLKTLC